MISLPTFDSQEKVEARRIAAPSSPFRNGLFLPSSDAGDLRQYQSMGLITDQTRLTLVEWDTTVMAQIRATVGALGLRRAAFHLGDITTLRPPRYLDFAFIDLLGTLSEDLLYWFSSSLQPSLTRNARVAITLHGNFRNSTYMKLVQERFLASQPIYQAFCRTTSSLHGKRDEVMINTATYMLILESYFPGLAWKAVTQYINSKSPMVILVFGFNAPAVPTSPSLHEAIRIATAR